MKKLLLRADDLGYSEGVNLGIAKAVKDGLIKTVGLMTNMPHSQAGYELIKDENVCLGLHTNITVGKPFTDPKLIPSITTKEGLFKPSKEYRTSKEDFIILDQVLLEIEAQYQEFVRITGRKPDYIEGHAINVETLLIGLKMVALKYDLKFSGFPEKGVEFTIQGTPFDISMESANPDYDPFLSLKHIVETSPYEYVMFVTHPGYLDAYILSNSSLTTPRPFEVDMVCDPKTKAMLQENKIQIITYNDL